MNDILKKGHVRASDLAAHGVKVADENAFILECDQCGKQWRPNVPDVQAKRDRTFWQCPERCNVEA